MRRTFWLWAFVSAAMWLLLVAVVANAPNLSGFSPMLLAVGLLLERTAQAGKDTRDTVRDVRAWWRRRRAVTTYRVGHMPVRPDVVANQAA